MKKIKKKKKSPPKNSPPKRQPVKHEVALVIRQEIASTIRDEEFKPVVSASGKSLAIPKTWISEKQLMFMISQTPPNIVRQRPGPKGITFDYVPGWYFKKVLNYVFGWMWDFEVIHEPTIPDVIALLDRGIKQVWVTGRLTVKDGKGNSIVKTQSGSADIKFLKDSPKQPVDIGNDIKAAITDSLKKCASEFGICSDVYWKNESKNDGYKVNERTSPPSNTPPSAAPKQPERENPIFCHGTEKNGCPEGNILTEAENSYSMKFFKRPLCRTCQTNRNK